jgi:gamma-glutamyltranspeptidase / glutathione hydrolase
MGDPSFVPGMQLYQDEMLNSTTEKLVRGKISDTNSHNVSFYDPDGIESLDNPGTSQISVADKDGMAISLTTTINTFFGSKVLVPESGIILNNEMSVAPRFLFLSLVETQ